MLARVASFDTNMIELRRMKVAQFRWPFFATIRAYDPTKFPRRKTRRAYQIAVATLSSRFFVLQKTDLRIPAAKGARAFASWNSTSHWFTSAFIEPSEIRLQKRFLKKLNVRSVVPVCHQRLDKSASLAFVQLMSLSRQRRWPM